MAEWPTERASGFLNSVSTDTSVRSFWQKMFDKVYSGQLDTWDYQWIYSIMKSRGLCIHPQVNMIKNVGFDSRATHTRSGENHLSIEAQSIKLPLKHPGKIEIDALGDQILAQRFFRKRTIFEKIRQRFL
jgi:hypothetical protein